MAREARERKAQEARAGSAHRAETQGAARRDTESTMPSAGQAFVDSDQGMHQHTEGQTVAEQSGQRRSPRAEHGKAIRRMRTPIGAGDAADILGPREEAPQEARVERIEERLRARKRLTTLQILSAVGVVFATAALVWVVFFSSLFALDTGKIEIDSNASDVPADAIHSRVAPFAGIPLTRLSAAAVEESIEGIPQIKDAQVSKAWPNGLRVSYVMRTPAMVTQVNGSLLALDEEGIELGQITQRPAGVPVVVLPEDPDRRAQHAQGVIAAWKALPEDVRNRVESMTVANHQLTMALQEGRQVRWGTLSDEELKAKVLHVLLTQREAKVYDVSSPTSPVTSG